VDSCISAAASMRAAHSYATIEEGSSRVQHRAPASLHPGD